MVEWLEPDWVFDTAKRSFARGLLRRPQFDLEIWKTDGSLWPLFEPHHYLKLPRMIGAAYYVGTVDGELAVHLAVSTMNKGKVAEGRACRLVTMPEWQGDRSQAHELPPHAPPHHAQDGRTRTRDSSRRAK